MQRIRTLATIVVLGAALCAAPAFAAERGAAENGYQTQKVVYHINDAAVADAALRNVVNHLNAVGDKNLEAIVVTHGKGIDFLVEGYAGKDGKNLDEAVQGLANRGVQFQVCANTLRGRKIEEDKVNLNAKVVPSGVATVAELQQQGYAYVKP